MPSRPKKPCAFGGCINLVPAGKRFCKEHEKIANANYEKYKRDKDVKKKYGRRWTLIRDKYHAEHPFCERCFSRGIMTETEHVHHKIPIREGGSNDYENLMALCKSCHSYVHAKRGDTFSRR